MGNPGSQNPWTTPEGAKGGWCRFRRFLLYPGEGNLKSGSWGAAHLLRSCSGLRKRAFVREPGQVATGIGNRGEPAGARRLTAASPAAARGPLAPPRRGRRAPASGPSASSSSAGGAASPPPPSQEAAPRPRTELEGRLHLTAEAAEATHAKVKGKNLVRLGAGAGEAPPFTMYPAHILQKIKIKIKTPGTAERGCLRRLTTLPL